MDKNPASEHIIMARQGIYDASRQVYAYELLFRGQHADISGINNLNQHEGDRATSSVVTQLFSNVDTDLLLHQKKAFINFTRNHLLGTLPHMLPRDKVVIEVLETVSVDEVLLNCLIDLRKKGFIIALDDFILNDQTESLLDLAHIIKLDVFNKSHQEMAQQIKPFKNFRGKLLAEKIETHEQFGHCQDLGFDLFQGYFLEKPNPVHGQELRENKSQLMKIMTVLHDQDASIETIETLIVRIPKLGYRILRLANSASMYMGKRFDSLREAILHMGLLQIRNWITLLIVSSLDDVAPDLLDKSMIRAAMCEHLAKSSQIAMPTLAYTTGMFSTLDAIMNEPMADLLSKVPLNQEVIDALVERKGTLGALLNHVIAYEHGQFDSILMDGLSEEDFARAYEHGLTYARQIIDAF